MKKKYLLILLIMVISLSACNTDKLSIDNTSGPLARVNYIENSMESVRKMEKTLDVLKDELTPYIGVNTLDILIEGYIYEPHLNYWRISSSYDDEFPISYKDVKGLSLSDLKANFKDLHNEYVDSNFGDITVNIEFSDVIEDGYFIYVLTKKTIYMEHFGNKSNDELIIYKKYILINQEDGWVVSDIERFYDYDLNAFYKDDISGEALEQIIQIYTEAKLKFLTIDGEQIKFQ